MENVTIMGDNITLDLLLSRYRRGNANTLFELALALNPDIAINGPFLNIGDVITLPDVEQNESGRPLSVQSVTLFG